MKCTFLDVLDRAHSGPVCTVKEWDTRVILPKANEQVKKHGLKGTFTPDNPVSCDDALADEFWKAGFEYAVEVGMLCTDTQRVIKFTEPELRTVVDEAISSVTMGAGLDRVEWRTRRPGDPYPPGTSCGPFGTAVTEDLYVASIAASAQYRTNDVAMLPTPLTFYGRELHDGSPYEVLAGKFEALKCKEAVRLIDRPNMSVVSHVDATGWGSIGSYGCPGGLVPNQDWVAILAPSCLKTNYYLLNKIGGILNFGGISFWTPHYAMIGGYSGGPEASVVVACASMILQRAVHLGTIIGGVIYDLSSYSGSSRLALWSSSVALQAQSRNTRFIAQSAVNPRSGPCTKELLYEIAAQVITYVASGAGWVVGISPREGKYPNYFSGLEDKFGSELAKKSVTIDRPLANQLIKRLLEKYEGRLSDPPPGKSFAECTNIKTLQPTAEWWGIYEEVRQELLDMGAPADLWTRV